MRFNDTVHIKINNQDYTVEFKCYAFKDKLYNEYIYDFETLNVYKINFDLSETLVELDETFENKVRDRIINLLQREDEVTL